MKLLTALTLRSPKNSVELSKLGVAELIVQAMKVHSNDDKHQVLICMDSDDYQVSLYSYVQHQVLRSLLVSSGMIFPQLFY